MSAAVFLAIFALVPPRLLVLGPGDDAVQLIAAKLARNVGYDTVHVSRRAERCNKLMYGRDWRSIDANKRVKVASSAPDINAALASADGVVLCVASNTEAGTADDVTQVLTCAANYKRVVLLSAIGGSKGLGGLTHLGEGIKVLECEEAVKDLVGDSGTELSVVRVGVLKGGAAVGDRKVGLDAEAYYATMSLGGYPTPRLQAARGYDESTLGMEITLGDTIMPRSSIARASSQAQYSPEVDEISRINAASALVACLRHAKPVEVSLSAKMAQQAPTVDELCGMLEKW